MVDYRNAYTEVYTILENLDEEEFIKIPPEIIEAISVNRNMDYEYELDEYRQLKDQEMLPETRAILFNLFRDYLSTPTQKEKIIQMQKIEREKNEKKKEEQYNIDVFANKRNSPFIDTEPKAEEEQKVNLIEYKENIFTKILRKIKAIWRKY